MHSSCADDVDATASKTELLAVKEIFNKKASHSDETLRALKETISDNRLLFPSVIIVIHLLLINHATSATPEI